jgi:hypothetical protein
MFEFVSFGIDIKGDTSGIIENGEFRRASKYPATVARGVAPVSCVSAVQLVLYPPELGMDVRKETMAVADIAQEHGAAVPSLGPIGPRQCAIDQRRRTMPAQANHLLLLSEAGPCGDWLSRYRTTKGADCWVVAPALLPQKAGARGTTDRRDAVPLARLARSGDLPAGYGPTVEDAAMRALSRAREETRSALKDVTCRRTAFVSAVALWRWSRSFWSPRNCSSNCSQLLTSMFCIFGSLTVPEI